ncbi:NAD(P)H-hydrate dehydratase [Rhodococcus sp. HNM0569]|uniref:NAD(P)H-hydrate dehydratase n=1 Tax=Rhodococcus sp. HNM0569 TaxID=2716340 RepID=UPI00146A18EF|nr:NAD(P)H-hydrate dehydratase [Rhodococcus sp. HNM0569]NLU81775.1 NAD(P)H-hydrate dehydratase [Rhodococcus sp. HNM0569]
MRGYFTTARTREAEAPLMDSLPDGTLMRRAAYGLARIAARELERHTGAVAGRRVGLLVGSGDNGGDALWAGTFLRRRGVAVTALLLSPGKEHAAGASALRRAGARFVDATDPGAPDEFDLVLDGIVGISGRGPLRPRAAELVAGLRAPIVAVDLPSGVDADTGAVDGPSVDADVTVAFGVLKPVHALAAARCGRVELVDIGLDPGEPSFAAYEPAEVGALWPVPGPGDDKYSQGVVGVVAGSEGYPGAGVLCTGGAVTATSGMVRYAGPDAKSIVAAWPEVIATPDLESAGRVQAWVVGPGAGTDDAAADRLRAVLATDMPVVVDADGLTLLAREPALVTRRAAPTLLTPHAGEFARLTGEDVGADRVAAVTELARAWGVTVLLKGRATVVSDGEQALVNDAGASWSSTAGSGDVLSGILGALVASGLRPLTAAGLGTRAHALAANLAAHGESDEASGGLGAAPVAAGAMLARLRDAVRVLRASAGARGDLA